jgi:hypothetical protein
MQSPQLNNVGKVNLIIRYATEFNGTAANEADATAPAQDSRSRG